MAHGPLAQHVRGPVFHLPLDTRVMPQNTHLEPLFTQSPLWRSDTVNRPPSPPKPFHASAAPTSHARDSGRWPPARSSSAGGRHVGHARNTRGPSAIGVALARPPRPPVVEPPARPRG